ncbi:unnamed protein product [Schistosoma margrebowiei]|uniref:Uncharacterized protein n=1 Tax=Schistosoma margrebowiei TaxID=48269 RepID=A0AA84ZJQ3_9TREM|nr:unnamed protein product [Schistosoma margrebowiei]
MDTDTKLKDIQLYRPPPGYTLNRIKLYQLQNVDIFMKQSNKLINLEQIDINELSKIIMMNQLEILQIKQTIMNRFIHKLLKSIKRNL